MLGEYLQNGEWLSAVAHLITWLSRKKESCDLQQRGSRRLALRNVERRAYPSVLQCGWNTVHALHSFGPHFHSQRPGTRPPWGLVRLPWKRDLHCNRFMYLFMCVLQWISIYEIHFGSRGYSFGIAQIFFYFACVYFIVLWCCTCVLSVWKFAFFSPWSFRCNL